MKTVDVIPIPAFEDNYFWSLEGADASATVVDPGDAETVERYLAASGRRLNTILVTHHHGDHVGGVARLAARWRVPVVSPVDDRIPAVTRTVVDGDRVTLDEPGIEFEVLHVPGHTRTHIAYAGGGHLFCGDTLFSVGCGRLFEGTPAQMLASLDRLAALDPSTLVYCAHEYTMSNCRFALVADPDNAALRARHAAVRALRAEGRVTLPSTLALERATNPFLRVDEPALRATAQARDPAAQSRVDTFAVLRRWKDDFRPGADAP